MQYPSLCPISIFPTILFLEHLLFLSQRQLKTFHEFKLLVTLPPALRLVPCWAECSPSKLPLALSLCLRPLICVDSQHGCCELCTCSYPTLTAKFLQMTVSKGDSGRNLKITVEHTMECWHFSLDIQQLSIQFRLKTVPCSHSPKNSSILRLSSYSQARICANNISKQQEEWVGLILCSYKCTVNIDILLAYKHSAYELPEAYPSQNQSDQN